MSKHSKMYRLDDINGASPTETLLYYHTAGYNPFDIVTQEMDLLGDGNYRRYAVGMKGSNTVYIFPLTADCNGLSGCYKKMHASGNFGQAQNAYGAAYAF